MTSGVSTLKKEYSSAKFNSATLNVNDISKAVKEHINLPILNNFQSLLIKVCVMGRPTNTSESVSSSTGLSSISTVTLIE